MNLGALCFLKFVFLKIIVTLNCVFPTNSILNHGNLVFFESFMILYVLGLRGYEKHEGKFFIGVQMINLYVETSIFVHPASEPLICDNALSKVDFLLSSCRWSCLR